MITTGMWHLRGGLLQAINRVDLAAVCSSKRASSTQQPVFNKPVRIKHLDASSQKKDAHVYDYLREHVAKEVCDRVEDLKLERKLDLVLNLGSCSGLVSRNLNPEKLRTLLQTDISSGGLTRSRRLDSTLPLRFPTSYIQCDEEAIPLRENSIDLVISCLNLHWVNDLVTCFKNVYNCLGNDCAFIGALTGGDTLYELRSSLQLAEMERLSGFSSHIAPKTTGQDIATLLQVSGFKLITVDISELKIYYPSMYELMFDLQGMGENNASLIGSNHMHRDVLQAGSSIYQSLYGGENIDQGVPATFQIIHFIGWKNPKRSTPLQSGAIN